MSLENCYSSIALILFQNVPNDWKRVEMPCEVGEAWSKCSFDYWTKTDEKRWFSISDIMQKSKIDDSLQKIRKQMTVPGQKPWSRCTFTLFPDGKFKFDVEYDD